MNFFFYFLFFQNRICFYTIEYAYQIILMIIFTNNIILEKKLFFNNYKKLKFIIYEILEFVEHKKYP